MNDMYVINATEVRNNWSQVADKVIREKPQFIKRTRDYMMLANVSFLEELLSNYSFNADNYTEADGSVTLSLKELDLVENAPTEEEVKLKMAKSILEYAEEFYNEFDYWSKAPNRKAHIPYIFKALILSDIEKIGANISCQVGKN